MTISRLLSGILALTAFSMTLWGGYKIGSHYQDFRADRIIMSIAVHEICEKVWSNKWDDKKRAELRWARCSAIAHQVAKQFGRPGLNGIWNDAVKVNNAH